MRKWVGLVAAAALSASAFAGVLEKKQGLAFEWGIGFNYFYNEPNVEGFSTVFKLAVQPAGNFSVAVFNESAQTSIEGGAVDASGDIRLVGLDLTYRQEQLDWGLTIGGATCNILGPGVAINDITPFADIGVMWKMLQSDAEGARVDVGLTLKHRFLDIADVVVGTETVRDLNMFQAGLSMSLVF